MWCQHDVLAFQNRIVGRDGFGLEHVQSGSRQMLSIQRVDQGGAIELAVQPGQQKALQRALEEGMESARAPTYF